MAEQILFVVFKVSLLAVEEVIKSWSFHEDLDTLRERLELVHALLSDAYTKKPTMSTIQTWLNKLEHVTDVANAFIDELAYEVTRVKVGNQAENTNIFLDIFIPSKYPMLYQRKLAGDIKSIQASFDNIFKWAGDLGLHAVAQLNLTVHSRDIRIALPTEDGSKIVGIDDDVSFLVQTMCNNHEEDLQVVAIVGMGGQGKTTLARMVYNSFTVINMFPKRMWITVSDDFDFVKILNQMVQSLTSKNLGLDNTEGLINELKTVLQGKKFVIVLDDVWNEESVKWDNLRDSLLGVGGSTGSGILVTTRNQKVVDSMQNCISYPVKRLSEDDGWTLFKQRTFSHEGVLENDAFAALGRSMVEKCGGIPLAIKELGGLLRSEKSEGKWLEIQHSEVWKSKEVLPSLKLSYDNLPYSSLKRCFTYCSILPKDSNICKDELIQIWMALGFLLPAKGSNKVMEDIGNEYFNILLWKSLLQEVERDEYGEITYFKMHGLVHDLALDLSKHHSVTLESGQELNHDFKAVYARIDKGVLDIKPTILKKNFERVKVLYAGVDILGDMIPYFTHLTVLVLQSDKVIKELPSWLCRMKYLRHLDISCFDSTLPTYIMELFNLQTLRVGGLDELPKKLSNFINLRHLYIKRKDNKRCVFIGIDKLTLLQTLPYFVASRDQNCFVGQLGGLENLRGKLDLYGLKDVTNMEEASKANLCKKSNIQSLLLHWKNREEDVREEKEYNDEDVMKGLEAHPNLKELTIEDFMGNSLASWITMMTNLVKFTLRDCKRCQGFPSLGHLPNLREIHIKGMENVNVMGSNSCGGGDSMAQKTITTIYPSLTKLILSNLSRLEEWVEADMSRGDNEQSVFPKLESLDIIDCPRLRKIPDSCFLSLKKLKIKNLESSMILETMSTKVSSLNSLHLENIGNGGGEEEYIIEEVLKNNHLSLTSLSIYGCKGLKCLNVGVSLDRLFVDSCPNLISINVAERSVGLKDLEIKKCPSSLLDQVFPRIQTSRLVTLSLGPFFSLKSDEFPWPFSSSSMISFPNLIILALVGWEKVRSIQLDEHLSSIFPALTDLYIVNFKGVKVLPDSIANLPSLRQLSIWHCDNLESLPTFEESHSLQQLEITNCPILKERCSKGSGTEWSRIQHIPHITLE